MGQIWKEELEIPNLQEVVKGLYEEIKPLYTMLHAAVRHKLQEKYGVSEISSDGPIPVHLLGNANRYLYSYTITIVFYRKHVGAKLVTINRPFCPTRGKT